MLRRSDYNGMGGEGRDDISDSCLRRRSKNVAGQLWKRQLARQRVTASKLLCLDLPRSHAGHCYDIQSKHEPTKPNSYLYSICHTSKQFNVLYRMRIQQEREIYYPEV